MEILRGKVWKFGDRIATDYMEPALVEGKLDMPMEEKAQYCMNANRPGWPKLVSKGDILIAGQNFGCGSSRNVAEVLIAVGIGAVVAESTSRIFLRNAVNTGLPVMWCPGISQLVDEGDEVEVDLVSGRVRNVTKGTEIIGDALPEDSPPMQILQAGGFHEYLKRQLAEDRGQSV